MVIDLKIVSRRGVRGSFLVDFGARITDARAGLRVAEQRRVRRARAVRLLTSPGTCEGHRNVCLIPRQRARHEPGERRGGGRVIVAPASLCPSDGAHRFGAFDRIGTYRESAVRRWRRGAATPP